MQGMSSILILVAMIAVMYFFMMRPQIKKQKEQNAFQDTLAKGMDVVTASGIIGKINKVENNIITLQVDTKTFIRVTKGAISKELTNTMAASLAEANNFN
jgi:preprotein translocase subunit YajC